MSAACLRAIPPRDLARPRRRPSSGLIHLDLDRPRLRLLSLRQRHLEHAVPEFGLDLGHFHAVRQREDAYEGAERTLDPVVLLAAHAPRKRARPAKTQLAVLDAQIDLVLRHPRQIGPEDHALSSLVDVHRGRPRTARSDLVLLTARARKRLLEEAVHPLLERQ